VAPLTSSESNGIKNPSVCTLAFLFLYTQGEESPHPMISRLTTPQKKLTPSQKSLFPEKSHSYRGESFLMQLPRPLVRLWTVAVVVGVAAAMAMDRPERYVMHNNR
jgi:hypothetical protein